MDETVVLDPGDALTVQEAGGLVVVPDATPAVTVTGDSVLVVTGSDMTALEVAGAAETVVLDGGAVAVASVGTQGPAGPQGPPGSSGSAPTYTAENKDSVGFSPGAPVAVHPSGVGVVRADATGNGKNAVGLAVVGVAVGFAETVQTGGVFALADWTAVIGTPGLAAKAVYYLAATPGMLTATPPGLPGNVVQVVGRSVSATELELVLAPTVLL